MYTVVQLEGTYPQYQMLHHRELCRYPTERIHVLQLWVGVFLGDAKVVGQMYTVL